MNVPCRAAACTSSLSAGAPVRPSRVVNSTTAVTVHRLLGVERREQLGPPAHGVPHRDRRRLAEPADRRLLHRQQPLVDLLPRHRRAAVLELLAEVVERAVPDPARGALLARLLGEEAHRLAEQAERRVRRREHLERGRSGPGAVLREPVARQRGVERGRAAGSRSRRRRGRPRRRRRRSRPRAPRRARAS